jgi:hypothetical protein
MHIGCYRNLQFASDIGENIATFTGADPAKRTDRSAIGFVLQGFENQINVFRRACLRNLLSHAPDKLLRLHNARAQNECGALPANRHFSDLQRC